MSTKKDRLEAKRREQAAAKVAREEKKKAQDADIPEQVRQLDVDIKQAQSELDKVYRDAEMIGLSLRGFGKTEHFAGSDSGLFNNRLQAKRQNIHLLRLKKENLLNKQDPHRAQSIHANKVACKLRYRSAQCFWGTIFGDLGQIQKSDAPVKIGSDIEVIKRMSVGLILTSESPVRCYHTIDDRDVRCDCTQKAPREWCLSQRALELQAVGKLVMDDSTQRYQDVLIESGGARNVMLGLGGMGGAVTRALLARAEDGDDQPTEDRFSDDYSGS
jgi:hypothetical protein